jgi:hypothetical protein
MQQDNIEEIIIKKISVYKSKITDHLIETVNSYIEKTKNEFEYRSWDCNSKTSKNICHNILYQIEEFKYIRKNIQERVEEYIKIEYGEEKPFAIYESWINIYEKSGYQEFHNHNDRMLPPCSSGVLYLSSNNSAIQFAIFPEKNVTDRTKIIPKKCELVLFRGDTYHRVLDSKDDNRMSLAFNFNVL